jgi:hypothetical protein
MWRITVSLILWATLISCGQDPPIAEYNARSPDEEALKRLFMVLEEGVKIKNAEMVAELIHQDALLMVGRDRQRFTKQQYSKVLPKRLAENPPIYLGRPKMVVDGDSAEVRLYLTRGSGRFLIVYRLRRVDGQWKIEAWEY